MNLFSINVIRLSSEGYSPIRFTTPIRIGIALAIYGLLCWIIGIPFMFALYGSIVYTAIILLLMRGLELLLRTSRVKGSIRFTRSHIIFESNKVHKIAIRQLAPIQIEFTQYGPMEHRLIIEAGNNQMHYAIFKFRNSRDITRFKAWLYLVQLQGIPITSNTQDQFDDLLISESKVALNQHDDYAIGYVHNSPARNYDPDFELDFDALD